LSKTDDFIVNELTIKLSCR